MVRNLQNDPGESLDELTGKEVSMYIGGGLLVIILIIIILILIL